MRSALAAGLALALFACGGNSSPSAPSNVVVAPADAGAAPLEVAARKVNASLPRESAWTASIDTKAVADLLASPDAVVLARESGFDLSTLAELGAVIDPARPILAALVSLSDVQRTALGAAVTRSAFGVPDSASVINTLLPHPFAATVRIVVPVTDSARARAAIAKLLLGQGLKRDGDNAFKAGKNVRVELKTDASTLVLDAALGRDPLVNISDMETRIRDAHADPMPCAPGEVLHVVYKPAEIAELSAYSELESIAETVSGESIDPSQRQRILKMGVRETSAIQSLLGQPQVPAVDHVDVIARRDGGNLAFELRATPGPASLAPPAEQWKPSPSFAPDGTDGFVTFSQPFASAWKLAGDPPNATLTNSPASRSAVRSGLSIIAALPLGVPVFARLTSHISELPDTAYDRFDRVGEVLTADGGHVDVGLMAKDVKPADAACILASKPQCNAPLKVGAAAVATDKRFARLLPVRGTTALAVAMADTASALDKLKLHATTADPLEANLPRHLGGVVDIPWITPAQHLVMDVKLDGNVMSAKLTPTP